jgi:hypothetical protein
MCSAAQNVLRGTSGEQVLLMFVAFAGKEDSSHNIYGS